ncbi:unnamed protein product [Rotaria magnacalcarata]|uniref:Uncharacterized protein n=1 Tax=Rotaria magnacalcarata TaxID=392030 RepID=A0A8S3HGA1_9BILA|nr:unnamed protein product [Rotaria magnacalcarata]
MTPSSTSTIITTEQNTMPLSTATISASSVDSTTVEKSLLFTFKPRIHVISNTTEPSTIMKPNIASMIQLPASSYTLKSTLAPATPWYEPDGSFDWWQRQWYATIFKKPASSVVTTIEKLKQQ